MTEVKDLYTMLNSINSGFSVQRVGFTASIIHTGWNRQYGAVLTFDDIFGDICRV